MQHGRIPDPYFADPDDRDPVPNWCNTHWFGCLFPGNGDTSSLFKVACPLSWPSWREYCSCWFILQRRKNLVGLSLEDTDFLNGLCIEQYGLFESFSSVMIAIKTACRCYDSFSRPSAKRPWPLRTTNTSSQVHIMGLERPTVY
jgi:hypothetical protein